MYQLPEEPVKQLLEAVSKLVGRVLIAGTDLHGKLSFWGKPLLTDDEIRDWRTRLEALKTFTEGLMLCAQRVGSAREECAVDRERAVVIDDQMLEAKLAETGHVDGDHRLRKAGQAVAGAASFADVSARR